MIELHPVQSSAIRAIGYDPDAREMHIEFVSGGRYAFRDIEPDEHAALVGANSIGRHFARHFARRSGNFAHTKR